MSPFSFVPFLIITFFLFLSYVSVFKCAGFAPLLLSAHFLKYSARPLQPTQPCRILGDHRSVDTHPWPLVFFCLLSHLQKVHSSPPCLYLPVSSRSLQATDEALGVRPQPFPLSSVSWGFEDLRSLKEKLWDLSTVHLQSPHQQEHKNRDYHGSQWSRNM